MRNCNKCGEPVIHKYKTNKYLCNRCINVYATGRAKKLRKVVGTYEYYKQVKSGSVRSAKKRGLEHNMKIADFIDLYKKSKVCHYCHLSPEVSSKWLKARIIVKKSNCFLSSKRLSLDRKDNAKGYIKTNIVLACVRCNYLRGIIYTYKEFKKIGKVLGTFKK